MKIIILCYITKLRTNGGTQNENEIKIKIAAMRTNENEIDSGQKTHNWWSRIFRSQQQLHGPVTIACCGHSAEFGHRLPSMLTFSRCRWSAKLNKQLYDRWTQSVDNLKTVLARAWVVTKAQPKHFMPWDVYVLLWLVQSHVKTHCT